MEMLVKSYPVGKLPYEDLKKLLASLSCSDQRVRMGPGVGLDCAVIDFGDTYLVAKTDPITFTAEDLGWYAVHVNANDIATTGAQPKWFLATLLLPESTESYFVEQVFADLQTACTQVGAVLVGGHTEITSDLNRAILTGTMLGEVEKGSLITPRGAQPGDVILLSKGIPIEAGSILVREFAHKLGHLEPTTIERARNMLIDPGISVVREALVASRVGGVTAMHDPTEGGLAAGLWEMADAAEVGLLIEIEAVPILPEVELICRTLSIDPFSAIASGALLLTVDQARAVEVTSALLQAEIPIAQIGKVSQGSGVRVVDSGVEKELPRPERDALAMLFEQRENDRIASGDEG